jgi:hypothetical protein
MENWMNPGISSRYGTGFESGSPSSLPLPCCPETLTVAFADGRPSTVTFEYNQDVARIEAVQAQIRSIRQSFDLRPEAGPLS